MTICTTEDCLPFTPWPDIVAASIVECDALLAFVGKRAGGVQSIEIPMFTHSHPTAPVAVVFVAGATSLPSKLANPLADKPSVEATSDEEETARRSFLALGLSEWITIDGLPIGYPFRYEKDIVGAFVKGQGALPSEWSGLGCPARWPAVSRLLPEMIENPARGAEIGVKRKETDQVLPDARLSFLSGIRSEQDLASFERITFLEAGPRNRLRQRKGIFNVGILVSGGIAPGINAVIEGIVTRHYEYNRWLSLNGSLFAEAKIFGYPEGFRSLQDHAIQRIALSAAEVEHKAEEGGSLLGTSRLDGLLDPDRKKRMENIERLVGRLRTDEIRILYIIGGEGSMRAAQALSTLAERDALDLAIVGIPKTMDNDILWVWQSFGFLSAVEQARHFILNLHTEVKSNPRLGIVQLFGSDSGFVASHAAYSTACDLVLIPEDRMSTMKITSHLARRLIKRYQRAADDRVRPYALAVMAETAIPTDAGEWSGVAFLQMAEEEKQELTKFIDNGWRVSGQTPDKLRSAGLRIVSGVVQEFIRLMPECPHKAWQEEADWNRYFEQAWQRFCSRALSGELFPRRHSERLVGWAKYWDEFRVVTNEPRHLIRSIRPSVSDVIFGERLGTLAVDNAMAGYRGFMVSQWLTEYVLVPLSLVVLGRKRVPPQGIFWKSVLAKTGQPAGEGAEGETDQG